MIPPPSHLNGARVAEYAVFRSVLSPTGMTRHLVDGKLTSPIEGLAICRKNNDEYFLFYCNEDWGVLASSSHASIDDARQGAEFENDGVIPNWQTPKP